MTMTSLSAALGERWTPVQVADLIVVLTDNGDNCSLAPSTHLSVTQDSLRPTSGLGLPRGCPPPPAAPRAPTRFGAVSGPLPNKSWHSHCSFFALRIITPTTHFQPSSPYLSFRGCEDAGLRLRGSFREERSGAAWEGGAVGAQRGSGSRKPVRCRIRPTPSLEIRILDYGGIKIPNII